MGKLMLATIISVIIIGGMIIANTNNLDLNEPEERKVFVKEYSHLIFNTGKNIKDAVGYVVKQDWGFNETVNSTKN